MNNVHTRGCRSTTNPRSFHFIDKYHSVCSPTTLELCVDDTARAAMIEYAGWSVETLKASILFAEEELKAAEHNFKTTTRID